RDPMAMLPFCGYHMGDYLAHWLEMGKRMTQPPRIFHVNWFRQDEDGEYLWPGYGENLRVLEWILDRCREEAKAQRTAIGHIPAADSLDLSGLDVSEQAMEKLLAIDRDEWLAETERVAEFFEQFGERFPKELWEQLDTQKLRLKAQLTKLKPGLELRPLAAELNDIIERENPHVYTMLSDLGRRCYFPKGILRQSAEAKEKATRFNATIGIARENGQPMFLPSIMEHFPTLSPVEALTYAPATGQPELRKRWRELLLAKNPSLEGKSFSMPIVTNGVTHALSLVGDMFLNPTSVVLLPDKFWENYELLFAARCQAQMMVYPLFNGEGGFNVEGLRQALATRIGSPRTIVILNFPNNPTGYSITTQEAEAIVDALVEAAENGCNLVAVTDDAYFGLFYEDDVLSESLFAKLAGAHERILAIKVDGPTKEQFVWGFRTGMITFSARAAMSDEALYGALEQKVGGAIRSAISNCSQPAQSVLSNALVSEKLAAEQAEKRGVLQARAKEAHRILGSSEFADVWDPYPFNAGYFMCLKLKHVDAEAYRKHLLDKHGIGVIADGESDIRVAFSSVELDQLPELYATMAEAAREVADSH
ncbi:MAG: phosphoenolpyruvate carboxykinase (GTP), partial [Armatimonadetes bacterium]|nr:phosphoenolpyruvate carboxykinase (GTP) [Armatimonadota bacterium]